MGHWGTAHFALAHFADAHWAGAETTGPAVAHWVTAHFARAHFADAHWTGTEAIASPSPSVPAADQSGGGGAGRNYGVEPRDRSRFVYKAITSPSRGWIGRAPIRFVHPFRYVGHGAIPAYTGTARLSMARSYVGRGELPAWAGAANAQYDSPHRRREDEEILLWFYF